MSEDFEREIGELKIEYYVCFSNIAVTRSKFSFTGNEECPCRGRNRV